MREEAANVRADMSQVDAKVVTQAPGHNSAAKPGEYFNTMPTLETSRSRVFLLAALTGPWT